MVSCSPSLLYNAIFCFTGILGVLLIQYLDYQGIGNPASGLSTMTMFLGLLLLSVPIQICIKHNTPFDWRLVFFLLLNICGEATTQYSISKLGSGIYIVVYSSTSCFAVLYRRTLLKRQISTTQLCGLICTVIGLVITITSSSSPSPSILSPTPSINNSISMTTIKNETTTTASLFIGVVAGLLSAAIYAAYYVLGEAMLTPSNDTSINNALQIGLINTVTTTTSHTKQKQPLNPATVGTFTGWGAMIIMLPWLIFWDGTHWNQYITKPMLVSNADPTTISIVYFLLIIINGLHVLSLLYLFQYTDSIVPGINKAVQAISIFVLSSLFYCQRDAEQCMDVSKSISIVVVVAGVVIYTYGSHVKAKKMEKQMDEKKDFQNLMATTATEDRTMSFDEEYDEL